MRTTMALDDPVNTSRILQVWSTWIREITHFATGVIMCTPAIVVYLVSTGVCSAGGVRAYTFLLF